MVYCGKPSTGCQACRDRKTRCDRLTPSCSQCVRARRMCPGYRDQLDLMFRNESETVIGKATAKAKATKKAKPKPTLKSPPVDEEELDEAAQDLLRREVAHFTVQHPENLIGGFAMDMVPFGLLGLPPNTALQHRAQSFFYSKSRLWLHNFDLLGTLCTQTNADEHLLASMSAVGLATLSNSLHIPELLYRARTDYIKALQLTNAALRSPTEVKKDSTLFSIMILSIYETLTGQDEKSLGAWTKHVNGATAVIKLRGAQQFKTLNGQRMFLQVLSYLMLSCMQRALPMPKHMIELRDMAAKNMDTSRHAWASAGVIIDCTKFRADLRKGNLVEPRQIITKALELDRRFREIFEPPPKEFEYKTLYMDGNPQAIWNGVYHVYTNHWTAQIWNGSRTCRILLHEAIRDQLKIDAQSLFPSFSSAEREQQAQESLTVLHQCRDDILASVPQHTTVQNSMQPASLIEGSRGHFVVWPLYLVGVMDDVQSDLREWVIQKLLTLSDVAGIRQARVLGEHIAAMAEKEKAWDWENDIDLAAEEARKQGNVGFFDQMAGIGRFEELPDE